MTKATNADLDFFQVRIVIQVLSVDVGDDRDRRSELQERAVAFIRFGDKKIAFAQLGIASECVQVCRR